MYGMRLQCNSGRQMSEGLKSSLTLNQNIKKQSNPPPLVVPSVQYKQVGNQNDFIGELSDQQKQAEFNKQHEEYIKMKLIRKMELLKLKKQQFGTSSSEEKQYSSDEEIGEAKNPKKLSVKKQSQPKVFPQEQGTYFVILQLKKLSIQTQLCLLPTQFEINKKQIAYSRIIKICLFKDQLQKKNKIKIVLTDEQFNITHNNKQHKSVQIFVKILKYKLISKNIPFKPTQRKTAPQEYTNQQKEESVAYDKIFKKSQIIGTWQQRYVIIKPDGLYSYRALKSNPTMYITLKEMKQLQTQFDLYKDLLVLKLVYNTTKTDFGLPLDPDLQWINHFANLITK